MKLIRKVNVKSVVGTGKAIMDRATAEGASVMKVWGRADGVEDLSKINERGEQEMYFYLVGDFRARAEGSEETYAAPKLSLPDYAMSPIRDMIEQGAKAVELGYVVKATLDENSPMGYRFDVEPVLEDGREDPLIGIERKVNKALK